MDETLDKNHRKFVVALVTQGLMFTAYLLTAPLPSLSYSFDSLCWALGGVGAGFFGFNVLDKLRRKKTPTSAP